MLYHYQLIMGLARSTQSKASPPRMFIGHIPGIARDKKNNSARLRGVGDASCGLRAQEKIENMQEFHNGHAFI